MSVTMLCSATYHFPAYSYLLFSLTCEVDARIEFGRGGEHEFKLLRVTYVGIVKPKAGVRDMKLSDYMVLRLRCRKKIRIRHEYFTTSIMRNHIDAQKQSSQQNKSGLHPPPYLSLEGSHLVMTCTLFKLSTLALTRLSTTVTSYPAD